MGSIEVNAVGSHWTHPVLDKVVEQERNLQGSSFSHGAALRAQYVPSGATRMRKETARQLFPSRLSWGQGHDMRKESARQLFPSELSQGPSISLSSFCLTVVGLSINFWK